MGFAGSEELLEERNPKGEKTGRKALAGARSKAGAVSLETERTTARKQNW